MGIYINGRPIQTIYYNGRNIKAVYSNGRLIWSIKGSNKIYQCCFSNGYWIDEYPWFDDQRWVD